MVRVMHCLLGALTCQSCRVGRGFIGDILVILGKWKENEHYYLGFRANPTGREVWTTAHIMKLYKDADLKKEQQGHVSARFPRLTVGT